MENISFLHRMGEWGLQGARSWNKALDFLGQTVLALVALVTPRRGALEKSDPALFIGARGVDALPIVTLIAFAPGLIAWRIRPRCSAPDSSARRCTWRTW